MKKVCVFVGSRANYSSARSIMREIQRHPGLELQLVLGAAALLDRFGNIEQTIRDDGFAIDAKFYMIVEGENPTTMAKSTGLGIIDVTNVFNNLQPDIVLVIGDRFDVMAPVIGATFMNIPIAHTMGGERSGTIDESIRHAITKFAHIHFPANEDARQRILKLGEPPDWVFNVGCPRMDYVIEVLNRCRRGEMYTSEEVFQKYKGVGDRFSLEAEDFLLVSHHPVTTEYGSNRGVMEEILAALADLRLPTIMLWPNADAGSDEVSKAIRVFRERYRPDWLHLFINLPIDVYVQLMFQARCMIGNSSSAIREGEAIGIPAVNIGNRQNMRVKGANIVDVAPSRTAIVEAVRMQMEKGRIPSQNLYGDGTAGSQIAAILACSEPPIQKCISY